MGPAERDFIFNALCPQILVVASDDVADIVRFNRFDTLAEMLQPFAQEIPIQATFRREKAASYYVDVINTKFIDEFAPPPENITEKTMSSWVGEGSDADAIIKIVCPDGHVASMENLVNGLPQLTPWYHRFRQAWTNSIKFSEHETFGHPIACLAFVTTANSNPIKAFMELSNSFHVQSLLGGSYSNPLLMHYILVHDESTASSIPHENLDRIFADIQRHFAKQASLLRVGQPKRPNEGDVSHLWHHYRSVFAPPAEGRSDIAYGQNFSERDVKAIRDTVRYIIAKCVLPHMEQQIQVLCKETENQRRAITGRLFSVGRKYFGNTNRGGLIKTGIDGETYYSYSSIEAKMRKLADYAFMMKDFRFAQTVYQAARRDFELDKVWKYVAGAQEMVGICKLLSEVPPADNRADYDVCFGDAITCYLNKAGKPMTKFAIRCVMLYAALLQSLRLFHALPAAFLRVVSPAIRLPTAVFLEQAAFAFLVNQRHQRVRRSIFNLVAAAKHYFLSGEAQHAHRCYLLAHRLLNISTRGACVSDKRTQVGPRNGREVGSPSAEDNGDGGCGGDSNTEKRPNSLPAEEDDDLAMSSWSAISSFIHYSAAQTSLQCDNSSEAFKHLLKVFKDTSVEASVQRSNFKTLMDLYPSLINSEGGDAVSLRPPAPRIDSRRVQVSTALGKVGNDAPMIWDRGGSRPILLKPAEAEKTTTYCSIGEVLQVTLVLVNPLHIDFDVTEFTVVTDAERPQMVDVSTIDRITLRAGDSVQVALTIRAVEQGTFSIRGARFVLAGLIPCFVPLSLRGKRLNETKAQRVQRARGPDRFYSLRASPEYTNYSVAVKEVPEKLMSGETRKLQMSLTNNGPRAIRQVCVWASHPSFFHFQERQDFVMSPVYPRCEVTMPTTRQWRVRNTTSTVEPIWLPLPGTVRDDEPPQVGPGEICTLDLWIRGDRVGMHDLELLVGCSTEPCPVMGTANLGVDDDHERSNSSSTAITMRTLCMRFDCVVTPSLRINAFVRSSERDPRKKILGVEVENLDPHHGITLLQCTSVSCTYQLAALFEGQRAAILHADTVAPGQVSNLVYMVKPGATPLQSDEDGRQKSPEQFFIDALGRFVYNRSEASDHGREEGDNAAQTPGDIPLTYSSLPLADNVAVDIAGEALRSYLLKARTRWRINAATKMFPLIPTSRISSIFPLYETNSFDFILFWSNADGSVQGHHSITGIDLGTPKDYFIDALMGSKSMSMPSRAPLMAEAIQERRALIRGVLQAASARQAQDHSPLFVVTDAPSRVPARSLPDSFTYVPVRLTIHNLSWKCGYAWTLELLSSHELKQVAPNSKRDDEMKSDAAAPGTDEVGPGGSGESWSWVGQTTYHGTVQPGDRAMLDAKAVIYSLGVVNVNMWRLTYRPLCDGEEGDSEPTVVEQELAKRRHCRVEYPSMPKPVVVVDKTSQYG